MYTVGQIIDVFFKKGYTTFYDDSKPYNLNYVGVRDITGVNSFNDVFIVFWKHNGHWSSIRWNGTTDPGTYWLQNPMNPHGTAILKEGQWRGCWKLGLHQGKYEALVQRKEVTVIRDGNKDNVLNIEDGYEDTGFFGINHHRANSKTESIQVDKWSAGCQVTANPNEYDTFIQICKESKEIWGEALTYTLLNKTDFE
tara:strand:- start:2622 stop:3212 length:591 start_codon:yes stop_codon:yes gene_type:complete